MLSSRLQSGISGLMVILSLSLNAALPSHFSNLSQNLLVMNGPDPHNILYYAKHDITAKAYDCKITFN